MRRGAVLGTLLFIATTAVAPNCWGSDIMATVADGWKAYKERSRHGAGTSQTNTEITDTRNGKTEVNVQSAKVAFKHNGPLWLADVSEVNDGRARRRVYGKNSRYSFLLEHRVGGWMLSKVATAGGPEATHIHQVLAVVINDAAFPQLTVDDEWLPDYGKYLAPTREQDGGVTLQSQSTFGAIGSKNKRTYHKLTLGLGSPPYYPVERYEADVTLNNSTGTETRSVTTRVVGDTVVPVRTTQTENYVSGGIKVVFTTRTDHDVDPSVIPAEAEFTMSAYGLPEPQGVVWRRPTPRYLYLITAALGLALLAATFRWLARRTVPRLTTPQAA